MGDARVYRRRLSHPAARWSLGSLAVVLAMAPALFGQTGASAQADNPTVTITWPKDGQVITDNTVAVVPEIGNWSQRCDLAGTANKPGTGHWHLAIDGSLVNMFCGPAVLSLENVKPGMHTLAVIPAKNDHDEVEAAKASVKIDYEPTVALPTVGGISIGKPRVSILSPTNGATVTGRSFPLAFDVRNFRLSCDLMGKAKLANTGHWHVDIDKAEHPMMMMPQKPAQPAGGTPPSGGAMPGGGMMGMMSMAEMLAMGCNNVLDVPLSGVGKGKHTFFVVLVDNQHEPIEPAVSSAVTVTVK